MNSQTRLCLLAFGALAFDVGMACAQTQTLQQRDVLELAQREHPTRQSAEAARAYTEGQATRASLYPNPSLAWNRAVFLGDEAEREESIAAIIPIDLSTRRSAGARLARASGGTRNVAALREKNRAVARALELFFDLIAERERIAVLERADAVLAEVSRVAQRRVEEGQAASYEAHRLSIEAQLVHSQLAQARMRERGAHVSLAAWLGLDPKKVRFEGSLGEPSKVAAAKRERPSLATMKGAVEAAEEAQDDADWTWVPTINVQGGVRFGREGQSRLGYVAGVSLALPLFSRGQGIDEQSSALSRGTKAQLDVLGRNYAIAMQQAAMSLRFARQELERFERATSEAVEQLSAASQARYIEGEGTLVALVDARRATTEVELRRVELRLGVKRAQVALREAQGEFE